MLARTSDAREGEKPMRPDHVRAGRIVLGVTLGLSLAACGGGSGSPTTPAPSERVIVDVPGLGLAEGFAVLETFAANVPGGIRITVDWTLAENDIDIYLTAGQCDFDQFAGGQCQLITFSDSTTAKPERLAVTRSTPGTYTLVIVNNGPGDEQIAYQVVLASAS